MDAPVMTNLPRIHRQRRAAPADIQRPTRAEINLAHLRHNLHIARQYAGQSKIWGVLKADAYGHGSPAVGRTLERAGIDGLCVALIEEAIELRDAGIRLPILVMGGCYGSGWNEIIEHHLTPVLFDPSHIENLARTLTLRDEPTINVHVKVDTGMSRLGARPDALEPILRALKDNPRIRLTGMMTHLANADANSLESVEAQCAVFDESVRRVRQAGFQPTTLHASNSAGLLRAPSAHYDAIRPGIALFGVSPVDDLTIDLKPVMKVRSEVVSLRTVTKGDSVGYCSTWIADRTSRIATIPMGYADGLPRSLSNRGRVLIRGKAAPIAGNVSMDLITVDVTEHEGVSIGDEVILLGNQAGTLGSDEISTLELANLADTITWEILTGISRRVPRFIREP